MLQNFKRQSSHKLEQYFLLRSLEPTIIATETEQIWLEPTHSCGWDGASLELDLIVGEG